MSSPSHHLLETFAAVPFTNRVLDLGCGHRCHAEPLARLGFVLYVCAIEDETIAALRKVLSGVMEPTALKQRLSRVVRLDALGYPDAFFDWVVAYDVYGNDPEDAALKDRLDETRRVLKPGGWVYVAVPVGKDETNTGFADVQLNETMQRAAFALAEEPTIRQTEGRRLLEGIYRRVDVGTPL